MNEVNEVKDVPEERMKEVFRALVEYQDAGEDPARSRAHVAEQFALSEASVREIENTGVAQSWPPLD